MSPILTVLEGKWFPDRHVSIRDLFAPLFSVWAAGNDASYHYEQFTNDAAFRAAIHYAFESDRAKTIYVGAHGNANGIQGFHDEGISQTKIKNALNQTDGATKRGLYFGACSFCHDKTAKLILNSCPRVGWIAGYQTEVDWIDSSAIDLLFLRHYSFATPGSGTPRPKTVPQRLRYATERLKCDVHPLVKRLGFHVYVRGHRGRIEDLAAS